MQKELSELDFLDEARSETEVDNHSEIDSKQRKIDARRRVENYIERQELERLIYDDLED